MDMRSFDPSDDYWVRWGRLPHWSQPGTACFITFHTNDSLPLKAKERFRRIRADLLERAGIDPRSAWQGAVKHLSGERGRVLQRQLFQKWDEELDHGFGAGALREATLSSLVANSLLYADGVKYVMSDFVVMPNHVHCIASFCDETGLLKHCASWKRYTATRINRILGRRGAFWQIESFDHLIRSADLLEYYRDYIATNPIRAKLRPSEYVLYQKRM